MGAVVVKKQKVTGRTGDRRAYRGSVPDQVLSNLWNPHSKARPSGQLARDPGAWDRQPSMRRAKKIDFLT